MDRDISKIRKSSELSVPWETSFAKISKLFIFCHQKANIIIRQPLSGLTLVFPSYFPLPSIRIRQPLSGLTLVYPSYFPPPNIRIRQLLSGLTLVFPSYFSPPSRKIRQPLSGITLVYPNYFPFVYYILVHMNTSIPH